MASIPNDRNVPLTQTGQTTFSRIPRGISTVGDYGTANRAYHHPVVGEPTLNCELPALPDEGQRSAIFNAEPGSPSHSALRLLADPTAEGLDVSGTR